MKMLVLAAIASFIIASGLARAQSPSSDVFPPDFLNDCLDPLGSDEPCALRMKAHPDWTQQWIKRRKQAELDRRRCDEDAKCAKWEQAKREERSDERLREYRVDKERLKKKAAREHVESDKVCARLNTALTDLVSALGRRLGAMFAVAMLLESEDSALAERVMARLQNPADLMASAEIARSAIARATADVVRAQVAALVAGGCADLVLK